MDPNLVGQTTGLQLTNPNTGLTVGPTHQVAFLPQAQAEDECGEGDEVNSTGPNVPLMPPRPSTFRFYFILLIFAQVTISRFQN